MPMLQCRAYHEIDWQSSEEALVDISAAMPLVVEVLDRAAFVSEYVIEEVLSGVNKHCSTGHLAICWHGKGYQRRCIPCD